MLIYTSIIDIHRFTNYLNIEEVIKMILQKNDSIATPLDRDYYNTLYKSLLLGAEVGQATICSNIYLSPPKVIEHPFTSSLVENLGYNSLQHALFSPIKPLNLSNSVDNPIYLGILQNVKSTSSVITQSIINEYLYIKNQETSSNLKYPLIYVAGMTVFFIFGAIENSIEDSLYKWNFITTSTALMLSSLGSQNTGISESGAVNLSQKDTCYKTLGFIASFSLIQSMQLDNLFDHSKEDLLKASMIIGISYLIGYNDISLSISSFTVDMATDPLIKYFELDQSDLLGFNKIDLLSLASLVVPAIIANPLKDPSIAMKIPYLSIAKAAAVIGVTFIINEADAIKDYTCSFLFSHEVCEYIGVTDHYNDL